MRISDWSSDVCSSDLIVARLVGAAKAERKSRHLAIQHAKAPDHGAVPGGIVDRGSFQQGVARGLRQPQLFEQACLGSRAEELRVGKECVRTCRSRVSPYH